MSKYRDRKRKPIAEINVVPYIDVMLVLLVIFMITVPLIQQGVEVDLPQADAQQLTPSDQRSLVVEIDRAGQYFMHLAGDRNRAVTSSQLLNQVQAILAGARNTPVIVRADEQIPYGAVVQLMVLLQQAGAPKVGLSTEPPDDA